MITSTQRISILCLLWFLLIWLLCVMWHIYTHTCVHVHKHTHIHISHLKALWGISLVLQWLRICLPMQGTWVWSLVWEDPTCCRETKPLRHNYWSPCALNLAPQQEKPPQWEAMLQKSSPSTHCNYSKPEHRHKDPAKQKTLLFF